MRFTVELNQDEGTVDIDEEDLRAAYDSGGPEAVEALVQEEIDTFVRNNICAVAIDSEVAGAVEAAAAATEASGS